MRWGNSRKETVPWAPTLFSFLEQEQKRGKTTKEPGKWRRFLNPHMKISQGRLYSITSAHPLDLHVHTCEQDSLGHDQEPSTSSRASWASYSDDLIWASATAATSSTPKARLSNTHLNPLTCFKDQDVSHIPKIWTLPYSGNAWRCCLVSSAMSERGSRWRQSKDEIR